jgi:ferritin
MEEKMISKAMQDAINEQIKNEFYSAYLYLSMSAFFEARNLPGFAHWTRVQFEEEQVHALKLYDFVLERGGQVTLLPIDQPASEWSTNLQVFEQIYAHEQKVTGMINRLYETALAEKDYAAQVMLQWFITEQVEEEKNASAIVEQLKLIDARGTAVLMLDHQLAKRSE